MDPEHGKQVCFICCRQESNIFCDEPDFDRNIRPIICQHFWFQEDELQNATVCRPCCDKVSQFHQFYQEVKDAHERLQHQPPQVFIKQEEIDIDDYCSDNSSGQNVMSSEASTSTDEHKDQPSNANQPPRRTWKQSKPRKALSAEERQAQDEIIKQHMRYFCEECKLEFDSFCETIRHRIKFHNQTFLTCCDRQYKRRSMLYEHVINPGSFKCEFCDMTFKFIHGYHRHKKQQHKDEAELLFKCHHCPESFSQDDQLKRHLKEHDPTKCEVCGKQFSSKYARLRHIKYFHENQKDYVCGICSKGFTRKPAYLEHRAMHDQTPDKLREQCPVCNKWLKNHSCWQKHLKRHQTEGAYICDVCDHISVNSMSLRVHKVRQHGPNCKQHVCKLCGKSYSRSQTLKEHVASAHTGERLYQCQYCVKNFFSSATMYAHRKRDHPQEWLKDHMTKYASRTEEAVSTEVEEKGQETNSLHGV